MGKREITHRDMSVVDILNREVGELSGRNFAHRLGRSMDLVLRLDIYKKLVKHKGCVNTVSFNGDGDIIISGSDDRRVALWDWQTGELKLFFHSGHHNNVFQAKFMPFSDDRSIVTCAADGQVRHARILERGLVETSLLANHEGRAHKLAIEPGSPNIFYTCGEDGLVHQFDLRSQAVTQLLTCRLVDDERSFQPIIGLNTIAIDPRNPIYLAVAGSDEYARLYDIRRCSSGGSSDRDRPVDYFCPKHLIRDDRMGITGLAFSNESELLATYNDDSIYLFSKGMGLGPDKPPQTGETGLQEDEVGPQVYSGHINCATVKGVGFYGPTCEYVVSGSDCGRMFIWRKKGGELLRAVVADSQVCNCIEAHPFTSVLASSGIDSDVKVWTPKALEKATLPVKIEPELDSYLFDGEVVLTPEDVLMTLFSVQSWRIRRGRGRGRNQRAVTGDDFVDSLQEFHLSDGGDEELNLPHEGDDDSPTP